VPLPKPEKPPVIVMPVIPEKRQARGIIIGVEKVAPGQLVHQKFSFETAKLEIRVVKEWQIVLEKQPMGLWEKEVEVNKLHERSEIKILKGMKQGEYFSEDLEPGVKLEMLYIPAGSFLMGTPAGEEGSSNCERPQHQVRLQGFYLGKYPVTQAQFQAIMGENPSGRKGENLPVEKVSWQDAQKFCEKLRQRTGKTYRLPSESQWEYACRGGTAMPFCFGETITPDLANYDGNSVYGQGNKGVYRRKTTEVGKFPANEFGLYDMHGNIWEWCVDGWHENYEGTPADEIAWLENKNDYRLLRGGSWNNPTRNCRSAYRYRLSAVSRQSNVGFRVGCGSH
jgi:formylglycine-generating enzyme required for sulfatase activity